MASELQSAGQPIKVWIKPSEELPAVQHELIIRTRQQNVNPIAADILGELTLKTIGLWLTVFKAIETKTYEIDRLAPEKELSIERTSLEPLVTVFNKTWDGLSVTVNSGDDGKGAISAVLALDYALDTMRQMLPQLFQAPVSTQAKANQASASASQAPDIDEFLQDDPYQQSKQAPQSTGDANHPFRMFKRIAPSVIQMQEFIQGGGEKYQKSAIEATQSWHKKNPQGYDEGALVYYPITGAISLKEGRFGLQASIVTAKGSVYLDATNRNDEETVDWQAFKKDFAWAWDALETQGYYEPSGCLLVLKMSAASGDVQWKNYYHIYQAYHENNLPIGG